MSNHVYSNFNDYAENELTCKSACDSATKRFKLGEIGTTIAKHRLSLDIE